jgi:hypothetical protein
MAVLHVIAVSGSPSCFAVRELRTVWFQARSILVNSLLPTSSTKVSRLIWRMWFMGHLLLVTPSEVRKYSDRWLPSCADLVLVSSTFWCTWALAPVEVACYLQSKHLADSEQKVHLMQPSWVGLPHEPERDVDSATLPSALDLDWTFGFYMGKRRTLWCAFDITCFEVEQCSIWCDSSCLPVCFLLTWTCKLNHLL